MWTEKKLQERLIPYSTLRYSTDAFIDYRIPGCSPKKNYALIGPGVSQNPNQPVSLREKHGFQVGGVAMPSGVVNPPHMHFTAEVFICTAGHWQLHWGFNPDPLTAEIGPGDIFSVPTWIYRGFKNIGTAEGFMFTGLGQDDSGGILWGAQTLASAAANGLHLTEDYQIIDEQKGQRWDDTTMHRLEPMSFDEISQLHSWSPSQMLQRIVRFETLDWQSTALLDSALPACGAQLAPVIGLGMSECRNHTAPIANAHGFSIEWLRIPVGGSVSSHRLSSKQVWLCYQGEVELNVGGVPMQLQGSDNTVKGWDSYAMPSDVWRSVRNTGSTDAVICLITAGDARKTIDWTSEVQEAASSSKIGLKIDANGFVALKRFVDRSQR